MTREYVAVGFPHHLHALFLFLLWILRIADLCTSITFKWDCYLTLYKGCNTREQEEMEELDHDDDYNWWQIFDEESTLSLGCEMNLRPRTEEEEGKREETIVCVCLFVSTGEVRQCPDGRVYTLSKVRDSRYNRYGRAPKGWACDRSRLRSRVMILHSGTHHHVESSWSSFFFFA